MITLRRRRASPEGLPQAESIEELRLLNRIERAGLPKPETQVKLIPNRRFRFDGVFRTWKVAYEVQGGLWTAGRHSRALGYESDSVKSALAQIDGYIVLHISPGQIDSGIALMLIEAALRAHGWRA